MGKLQDLKKWFDVKFSKAVTLSPREQLAQDLKEAKERYLRIEKEYYDMLAKRDLAKKDMDNAAYTIENIDKAAKIKKDDEKTLQGLFKHREIVKRDLDRESEAYRLASTLADNLYEMKIESRNRISELESLINEADMKMVFSKSVESYKELAGENSDANANLRAIETDFLSSTHQLNDLHKEMEAERAIKDAINSDNRDFASWMESLSNQ